MKFDVKKYVAKCDICQWIKYETMPLVGLLQSLPLPTKVWEDILMDFIMGLLNIANVDTILVVVD